MGRLVTNVTLRQYVRIYFEGLLGKRGTKGS